MKKLYSALVLAVGLMGVLSSCSKKGEADTAEIDAIIAELRQWLIIQEDGSCAFPQDELTGDYILGVDNSSNALRVADNLSLGASSSTTLKVILPASMGEITVEENASEGHYFDISYNVENIPLTKLVVVNNAWLESDNAPLKINAISGKYKTYICKDSKCLGHFTASSTAVVGKCPLCGHNDIEPGN